jgi:hypothetical protein
MPRLTKTFAAYPRLSETSWTQDKFVRQAEADGRKPLNEISRLSEEAVKHVS